jgi:hypothetical protein
MTIPALQVPHFKVEVALMRESCGPSWWVKLTNLSQRPAKSKIFDEQGIIYPMKTTVRANALSEAHTWAEFLGVVYDGQVLGETREQVE